MNTRQFNSLAELKQVLHLGWPMVLTQLFIMFTGFMDTAMAGRYSSLDLAGVTLGGNVFWPTFLLLTGMTMALTPITSQLRGENRVQDVGHRLRQGLWISLATSTLLIVVLFNARYVYLAFGVDAQAMRIAIEYIEAMAWGVPPVVMYVALRYVSEGLGHTRPPMLIAGSILPLNGILNYCLIYGEFGFPELGGVGCGYATAIVFWVEFVLMLLVINRPFFRATQLFARFEGPDLATILSTLRIGAPIGFSIFLEMAMFSIIGLLVAGIGVNELAAHSIAGNLNWLTYVIPMAIGSAASIRVGFYVGSRNLPAARATSGAIFKFAMAYAVAISALLVFGRYYLIGIYTTDPAVIEIAAVLLLFIAVYQLVDDTQAVTIGALRGYKDTRVPMYLGLVGYWFIALPLGYCLAEEIIAPGLAPGVYGYWTGLTIGLALVAICVGIRLWYTSADDARILRFAQS
jgi:MATE family multidrug resistance protein